MPRGRSLFRRRSGDAFDELAQQIHVDEALHRFEKRRVKRAQVVDRREHGHAREPVQGVGPKRVAIDERFGKRERPARARIDAVRGERAVEGRRERRRIRIEHELVDQRFGGAARDVDILGILHDRTE